MRKANALLQSAGWSWERLLNGKVTVIADPFQSIPEPGMATPRQRTAAGAPSAPPSTHRLRATSTPATTEAQPPTIHLPLHPEQRLRWPLLVLRHLRRPRRRLHPQRPRHDLAANPRATIAKKWETICHTHNNAASHIPARRAGKQQPSSSTILNSI